MSVNSQVYQFHRKDRKTMLMTMRVNQDFLQWLQGELDKREWTPADLSRKSGVSDGHVSHLLSGSRGVGTRTLEKIAWALQLSKEEVFRRAGLLPSPPNHDPDAEGLIHIFSQLDVRNKAELLKIALLKYESEMKEKQDGGKKRVKV